MCAHCSLLSTRCPFTCLLDLDSQRTTWWFTHKLAAFLYPSDDDDDSFSFSFNFKSAFKFNFNFKPTSAAEDEATLWLPSPSPPRATNGSAEAFEWVPTHDPFMAIMLVRLY
jgi:hypothetical protein